MFSPRQLQILIAIAAISFPCLLYGQGGSPVPSDFTGSPVPAGPNVNEFTGDFTYGLPVLTVPGPNGSSYSMTLSYRAGTSPQAEPSWVGYGWSLNPGAVIRQKRGYPDDWDGKVILHNKVPTNYTVTSTDLGNVEFGSFDDLGIPISSSTGGSVTVRFNSETGFGKTWTIDGGASSIGQSVGLSHKNDNGDGSWPANASFNLFALAAHLLADEDDNSDSDAMFNNFLVNSIQRQTARAMATGRSPNLFRSRELNLGSPASVPLTGLMGTTGKGFTVTGMTGVVSGYDYARVVSYSDIFPEKSQTELNAYGYLHSGSAGDDALMDYYYEKDVPYMLDDKFLPIPFSNADVFTVAGGGSFRAFNRGVLNFQQNDVSSEIDVENEQYSAIFGPAIGAGARWGTGSVTLDVGSWENPEQPAKQKVITSSDEPWFFRFSHDVGGELEYDVNDAAVRASIENHSGPLGDIVNFLRINDIDQYPELPDDIGLQLNAWERPGRSGYIGFRTHDEMLIHKDSTFYKSFTKDLLARGYVRNREELGEQIGEFALYGSGGSRYVYGLPVYAGKEKSVQLGLKNIKFDSASNVHHNFLAYRYIDETNTGTVIGQEFPEQYAAAWLLTQITTPNYVDLTGDGPTDDDLGGWTRFHYWRSTRNDNPGIGWKFWRQPYRGLAYDAGDISNPEDDLGGYSQGYAEQYHLYQIETKTHVAVFVNNGLDGEAEIRQDGYLQQPVLASAKRLAGDSTLTYAVTTGFQPLRYLDRIELYTKGDDNLPDSLLTTVHFEYDYSLRPNMPNSLPTTSGRHGMLTLRKVWTESHNVRNARIAPYIFGYEYRKSEDYAANVQARYPEITSFADSLTSDDENPSYTPFDFDPWGNYRPNGAERLDRRFQWIPQNDTSTWDPAAWQLKWVKNPTGGEMHVQYEEDEYAFVQDKPAMAMVSLIEKPDAEGFDESYDNDNNNKYYLNLADIGVDTTEYVQVARVRELLERQKKPYFRFLYALRGDTARIGDSEHNSGYLEGYADLYDIGIDTIAKGDPDEWYALYVKLIGRKNGKVADHGVPKKLCWDYVRKRKRGKLGLHPGVAWSSEKWKMSGHLRSNYFSFHEADYCQVIDYAHSYIRVPMITPKKGGGLRVKRLLSYDPGIEGDSALYGTEYRYELYDQERDEVISSGVATTEPSACRDENPLINFLKRETEDDDLKGKVIAGRDRARNEGMIGETLLPSASVGYSRVATHPIHQGATTTGFGITDFYTFRDFPTYGRYGDLGNAIKWTQMEVYDYRTLPLFENALVYQQSEHLVSATQGYRFVQSDFHGKVRRQLSNGGTYTPYDQDWLTGAMTEYLFFTPGESIPLLHYPGDTIRYGYPGKEMEVLTASRRSGSYLDNFQMEGDAGFLFASGMAYFAVDNSELSTHVTTKVINNPAIVKGVLTYADGNYNYVENVAFEPRSGRPILTQTRDAYNGLVLDQSPSGHSGTYHSWYYPMIDVHPEFERIAGNAQALIQSTASTWEIKKGKDGVSGRTYIDFPGGSETRWLRKLGAGDLIELKKTSGGDDAGRYHVDEVEGNVVWLLPAYYFNAASDPAYGIYGVVNVEVIESGRQNAPGAAIGGVSTYGTTVADVLDGANFAWSGSDATDRLAFVNMLNTVLGAGSGTIDSTDAPGLEFELPITHSCGTLAFHDETYEIDTDGNAVYVGSPDLTTPSYVDTLLHIGQGGWFALNDAGQVVYRVKGRPALSQRVLNFTFCGDDDAYRTVDNVIGASAGWMSDTVDWDGGGVGWTINLPNAYETGERGRWSSRTGYVYKTDVTGSSQPVAGERVYKAAGVFDDFSLFNWLEPESSDWDSWIPLGEVTKLNKHNVPYSGVDMLGHTSVTLFDYGEDNTLLPVLSAWNAEEGTVAFESFENYTAGGFDGDISTDNAHSGTLSYSPQPGTFTFPFTATQQVHDNGLIVRFWMWPLSESDVTIKQTKSGSSLEFDVTIANRIARSGEWALYEYEIIPDSITTHYSVGQEFLLWFEKADPGDSVLIDDVKIQPSNSIMSGTAYHKKTFRPIVSVDDQNFGMYAQYDGQGRPIRSMVETSRGRKTVAESHVHVPGADRDWLGEGKPFTVVSGTSTGLTPTGVYDGSEDPSRQPGSGTQFDMLDLRIDRSGGSVNIFGVPANELRSALEKRVDAGLTGASVPLQSALDKTDLQLLERYEELSKQYSALQENNKEEMTAKEKEQQANKLKAIEEERDNILRKLKGE